MRKEPDAPTTLRLTAEDRRVLERLRKITGLSSGASVIRLAIREALSAREAGHVRPGT